MEQPTRRKVIWLTRILDIFFRLLYHQFAWIYDWFSGIISTGLWQSWVFSVLPYLAVGRTLEIGFGTGHLQCGLHSRNCYSMGIDASFSMSLIARKRLISSGFEPLLINGDAKNLPFPKNSFDQAVATFPSEYILNVSALTEILRVLQLDGKLVILPVAWITGKNIFERISAFLFRITNQSPVWDEQLFWDTFGLSLREAGFVEIEINKIRLLSSMVLLISARKFVHQTHK